MSDMYVDRQRSLHELRGQIDMCWDWMRSAAHLYGVDILG